MAEGRGVQVGGGREVRGGEVTGRLGRVAAHLGRAVYGRHVVQRLGGLLLLLLLSGRVVGLLGRRDFHQPFLTAPAAASAAASAAAAASPGAGMLLAEARHGALVHRPAHAGVLSAHGAAAAHLHQPAEVERVLRRGRHGGAGGPDALLSGRRLVAVVVHSQVRHVEHAERGPLLGR